MLLQSDFDAGEVIEYLRFKKSFLRRIRPEMAKPAAGVGSGLC